MASALVVKPSETAPFHPICVMNKLADGLQTLGLPYQCPEHSETTWYLLLIAFDREATLVRRFGAATNHNKKAGGREGESKREGTSHNFRPTLASETQAAYD